MQIKDLTKFIFEMGTLKHVKRSGWWVINVKDPENVAEHSFRAGLIAYILAKLEKADINKVALMAFFTISRDLGPLNMATCDATVK